MNTPELSKDLSPLTSPLLYEAKIEAVERNSDSRVVYSIRPKTRGWKCSYKHFGRTSFGTDPSAKVCALSVASETCLYNVRL